LTPAAVVVSSSVEILIVDDRAETPKDERPPHPVDRYYY
jgi:hypothetical protein